MAASEATSADKLWTPANIVTMVRICCVPVFVVAMISPWPQYLHFWPEADLFKPWVAALVFILIAATDAVDGHLARSRNEVTTFGKFLDPLADKILVAAALLALIELGSLPSWPALIILAREFIISGVRMLAASKGVVIAASWYGKAKTVAQIVAVVLFIVKSDLVWSEATPFDIGFYVFSWLVMLVALVLTVVSMIDYLVKARFVLGFATSDGGDAPTVDERVSAGSSEKAEAAAADGDEPVEVLAARVIERAKAAGKAVATAESLTGGLVAGALTSVPGSSAVVRGGIVSYAVEAKRALLGVDASVLDEMGAVSGECAAQMAAGARERLGSDVAVAVTGIAGPGGEEPGKPVGTVWLGVATASGCDAQRFLFDGDRDAVREATVREALRALDEALTR